MKYKIYFLFILGLIGVGALGWMKSGSDPVNLGLSSENEWDGKVTRARKSFDTISNKSRVQALLGSGFLPASKKAVASNTANVVDEVGADDDFPKILGVATVNGKSQVHLLVAERVVAKVPGEMLDSGWEIVSVDMDVIVASLNGKKTEFPIIEY